MSIFIEVGSETLMNPKPSSFQPNPYRNKYWFSNDGRFIYVFSGRDIELPVISVYDLAYNNHV
jgi:hypothetical protein